MSKDIFHSEQISTRFVLLINRLHYLRNKSKRIAVQEGSYSKSNSLTRGIYFNFAYNVHRVIGGVFFMTGAIWLLIENFSAQSDSNMNPTAAAILAIGWIAMMICKNFESLRDLCYLPNSNIELIVFTRAIFYKCLILGTGGGIGLSIIYWTFLIRNN